MLANMIRQSSNLSLPDLYRDGRQHVPWAGASPDSASNLAAREPTRLVLRASRTTGSPAGAFWETSRPIDLSVWTNLHIDWEHVGGGFTELALYPSRMAPYDVNRRITQFNANPDNPTVRATASVVLRAQLPASTLAVRQFVRVQVLRDAGGAFQQATNIYRVWLS